MKFAKGSLSPGLYLVSTPLGNARDITLRALDVLASADVLAAEDTRTLKKLMGIHGIPLEGRRVLTYHDHSKSGVKARLLAEIDAGRSVAYASEAGTPLIADPGYGLVETLRSSGGDVTAVPGPSAAITALSLCGLPTDRFLFAGFAPPSQSARKATFAALADLDACLVFYEAPGRVAAFLKDALSVFGPAREAAICRELTKKFEEVRRGLLGELAEASLTSKGEFVVILGKPVAQVRDEAGIDAEIRGLLGVMRLKDAVDAVAGSHGLPRRDVYQRALALKSEMEK